MDFYAPGLRRWQTSEWVPASPRRFLPVSVTGSACALSCDHCQAKVLDSMMSVRAGRDLFGLAAHLREQGSEGLLVSGGSTRTGGVPLLAHLHNIRRIREELGMKVIVHSGLVSPELAAGLAASGVDGVMLDVIGADETLRDVYHLDMTVADVDRSLELLSERRLRVIPHIVLGLHYGRFLGEYRALDIVTRYPVSALVLVVLVPLGGTPMAHVAPPPSDQVAEFFAAARLAAPSTSINLGCARPARRVHARARPSGDRPRFERHRLSGRGRHRVREVARFHASAVRVLLLAYLERGSRGRSRPSTGDNVNEVWRLLADDGAGAAGGLALDEALMSRYAQDEPECSPTLRLYSYRDHCALVGRYQTLEAEVDLAACRRTGTEVGRRLTGGGAIVMGSGQLGIAYVDRARPGQRPRETIGEISAALVDGCARLGIAASFGGKNDLEVGGRKIAGLGLYVDPAGAMLFHASVLADLDVRVHAPGAADTGRETGRQGLRGGERAHHDRFGRDRCPPRRRDDSTVLRRRFRENLRGVVGAWDAGPKRAGRRRCSRCQQVPSEILAGRTKHRVGRQRFDAPEDAGRACQDLSRHKW